MLFLFILFVADPQFGSWMREGNKHVSEGEEIKQLLLSVGTDESNILKLQPSLLVVLQEVDCFSGFLF